MDNLDFKDEPVEVEFEMFVDRATCRTCTAEENCKLSMYVNCCERYPNGPAFEEDTEDYKQAVLNLCHMVILHHRDLTSKIENKNRKEIEDIVFNLEQLLEELDDGIFRGQN